MVCFERFAQGAAAVEWAERLGWTATLMPGGGAPGARHAQTVLRTVCVGALSSVQAVPGLPLYFAALSTRASQLRVALAAPSLREGLGSCSGVSRCNFPSHLHRGVRNGRQGCTAKRSKGGGMGYAHSGGHERSRVPLLPVPSSPHHHLLQTNPLAHPAAAGGPHP